MNPEQAFLKWFEDLPPGQRHTLAYLYILVTSGNSGDFALTGEEALSRFHTLLRTPDFPLSRVARMVSIRGVFSFLFFDDDFVQRYVSSYPLPSGGAPLSLSRYQWLRTTVRWRRLSENALSDGVLHRWFRSLTFSTGERG